MIAALALPALAQALPTADVELFRPAVGSRFLWVDDARAANKGPFGSIVTSWARDPLRYYTGATVEPVVHDLAEAQAIAGYAIGPARLALLVPVVARSTGWAGGETGLGDLGASARLAVHPKALDLGIDGRLWLPTARLDAPVAEPGLAGEVSLVASRDVGPMGLAADFGYRFQPRTVVGVGVADDAATARLGAVIPSTGKVGATAELATQLGQVRTMSLPVEAVFGGRYDAGRIAVQAGVGHGFTTAVGSPQYRALVSVAYSSPARRAFEIKDSDGDGLADTIDQCPREPEDMDGWRDDDGCPDPTRLTARIVDENGALVNVAARVLGDGWQTRFDGKDFTGEIKVDLEPGSYRILTTDPAYSTAGVGFDVKNGPPQNVDLVVAHLVQQRLEVDGEIHFQTGSDAILADSWELLDGVAARLRADATVRRLRIEGHTDDVGDDVANLELSQRRADAVRAYLIGHGVDADRLLAVGLGETEPLVDATDDVARARNRRVEFYVELWNQGGTP